MKSNKFLRVRGQVTGISCDDVRAAFEDDHPRNKVDACDAYALSVFPFGRDDERSEDDESEIWETGLMVQGSRLMVQGPWAHHGLTGCRPCGA